MIVCSPSNWKHHSSSSFSPPFLPKTPPSSLLFLKLPSSSSLHFPLTRTYFHRSPCTSGGGHNHSLSWWRLCRFLTSIIVSVVFSVNLNYLPFQDSKVKSTRHGCSCPLVLMCSVTRTHGHSRLLVFHIPVRVIHEHSRPLVFMSPVRTTHGRSCPLVLQFLLTPTPLLKRRS